MCDFKKKKKITSIQLYNLILSGTNNCQFRKKNSLAPNHLFYFKALITFLQPGLETAKSLYASY